MKPLTFSVLRLLADGAFHSGEDMARLLGVSRTSIWNALSQLDELGVTVYKVRGRGYRLPRPIDFIDPARVRELLGATAGLFRLEVHETLPSTNAFLLERAAREAPRGCCVAAEMQSRGRGRRGRQWHTGLGEGLAFSLLWRFSQGAGFLGGLSLAVGVGLVRALRAAGLEGVALKWPNDVLWQYCKLAGVLIEVQGDMLGPSAAVIGVGLNVRLSDPTRSRIDQPVADVHSAGAGQIDRNALLAGLLRHLAEVLGQFEEAGFAGLREEWLAYHGYQGKPVRLLLPAGDHREGRVCGVAEDGSLLLEDGLGVSRFNAGEISLRAL